MYGSTLNKHFKWDFFPSGLQPLKVNFVWNQIKGWWEKCELRHWKCNICSHNYAVYASKPLFFFLLNIFSSYLCINRGGVTTEATLTTIMLSPLHTDPPSPPLTQLPNTIPTSHSTNLLPTSTYQPSKSMIIPAALSSCQREMHNPNLLSTHGLMVVLSRGHFSFQHSKTDLSSWSLSEPIVK